MSVRVRAERRRRGALHRVCIGAAIVAAGASAATIQTAGSQPSAAASADEAGASERVTPEPDPQVRRVVITPLDELDLVADPEPIDAFAVALASRLERVATAPPAPEPEPEPEPAADTTASIATTHVPLETWEAVARCESGYGGEPDWSINTGNGYYGGLQFSLSSWEWVGGTGYPHEASKATQIEMAERLWERQGWNAWPACSSKLGLR